MHELASLGGERSGFVNPKLGFISRSDAQITQVLCLAPTHRSFSPSMQRYTSDKQQYSAPPIGLRSLQLPWIQWHRATAAICAAILLVTALAISWLLGETTVAQVFSKLHALQVNPPLWVRPPQHYGLGSWLPALLMVGMAQFVMLASPRPQRWSRNLVVVLLVVAISRYVLWRSLASLNLANPVNGVFSLVLYGMEMAVIAATSIRLLLMFRVKSRKAEADRMSEAVLAGTYLPTVDILIPTYNEPAAILRRTVIGCQAVDYPRKQVYLLDDGKRPEIRQLAHQLGCRYIARPSNIHAKAGNINYALSKTTGELIAVFDADFIPTKNFLERTVGFFQERTIGLVQTQQSFYNSDPVARNLGLDGILPPEVDIFSRHYQPLRDTNGTTICYGSSFVTRRAALEEIDGFVTESLSEDYFTGIHLSAKGNRIVYLDEVLSAGLCAENMTGHILQRQRWARGTIQSFFIRFNPLTFPGFTLFQRLSHLEGIGQWFFSLFRVLFLLMPVLCVVLGIMPLRTTLQDGLYFFLPFYLLNLLTFSWLNERSRSALLSDIYEVANCIPVSMALVKTLFKPFGTTFKVTPKGISYDRHIYNWEIAWPLVVVWVMSAAALVVSLGLAYGGTPFLPMISDSSNFTEGMKLAWVWCAYNVFILSIALVLMRDAPKPTLNEWFERKVPMRIRTHDRSFAATSCKVSEAGAELRLQGGWVEGITTVELCIPNTAVWLTSQVKSVQWQENTAVLSLWFYPMNPAEYRSLVEFLFCQPGQWREVRVPSEPLSMVLLLKVFFSPLTWMATKVWKEWVGKLTRIEIKRLEA